MIFPEEKRSATIFELEGDDNFVQVDRLAHIIRADDVGYINIRNFMSLDACTVERGEDDLKAPAHIFLILDAGENHFSRREDE